MGTGITNDRLQLFKVTLDSLMTKFKTEYDLAFGTPPDLLSLSINASTTNWAHDTGVRVYITMSFTEGDDVVVWLDSLVAWKANKSIDYLWQDVIYRAKRDYDEMQEGRKEMKAKAMTQVAVGIEHRTKDAIDRLAKAKGVTRTKYIRDVLVEHVQAQEGKE